MCERTARDRVGTTRLPPRIGEPAVLALVECVKGGGPEMKVEPPLYIFTGDHYSREVEGYYA